MGSFGIYYILFLKAFLFTPTIDLVKKLCDVDQHNCQIFLTVYLLMEI